MKINQLFDFDSEDCLKEPELQPQLQPQLQTKVSTNNKVNPSTKREKKNKSNIRGYCETNNNKNNWEDSVGEPPTD
jgi:hypothetical protein